MMMPIRHCWTVVFKQPISAVKFTSTQCNKLSSHMKSVQDLFRVLSVSLKDIY